MYIALVDIRQFKNNRQQSCLELQRSCLLEAWECHPNSLLCQAYHIAEQIVGDLV